jgi:NAD(P)H-hydrate epimerase
MKIFSAARIREWDAFTIEHEPISSVSLMERAAAACFSWITDRFPDAKELAIFCGSGNNGGDGLALARMLLAAGWPVNVFILPAEKRSADFETNFDRYPNKQQAQQLFSTQDFPSLRPGTIIVDALFGTGLSRPLEGLAAALVESINHSRCTVISIDLPSGLFADQSSAGNPVVTATDTLSFQLYKLAFLLPENEAYVGNIHLLNIGLHPGYYNQTPADYFSLDAGEIAQLYKPRSKFSHKYNFGHALLYAGSRAMMGAAILCAKACLRSGAGLVTIHTGEQTAGVIQSSLPEAISSFENDWKILAIKKAAIGIGPGLENSPANSALLGDLVEQYPGQLVIDATALQLVQPHFSKLTARTVSSPILTPHTGEFEKLFGQATNDFDRIDLALQQSTKLNCYIILKGHHSFIACPGGTGYFNTTGNAGMATAGSGDVLTGILTALLAQGYSTQNAALLSVYLHGLAGDLALETQSQESIIASDIIGCLGPAFQQISGVAK